MNVYSIIKWLMIPLILCCGCNANSVTQTDCDQQRWSAEKVKQWYSQQPWLVGFNYVLSTACNTTEWWQAHNFDPQTCDRELGWASDIGYNTTRVFIQYIVWKQDPDGFKHRFDQFLTIAHRHHISVMPVLFDDCTFGDPPQLDPYPGKQRKPIPGMILPSWTPSPGVRIGKDKNQWPNLKAYVQDMIRSYANDQRIIVWDLFNEPMNHAKVGTPQFIRDCFGWARQACPSQPITVAVWHEKENLNALNNTLLELSDVISFHRYTNYAGMEKCIERFKSQRRPVLCTEWMARVRGSRFETDLLLFKKKNVGCYQWGLVNGQTQCQFPWSNKPGGTIDAKTGWFHDILHSDGNPYRPEEIKVIRKIIHE